VLEKMHRAVLDGVFPGAVLLVGCKGSMVLHEAFGLARLDPPEPMTRDTFFDLASLTKPLATAPACMLLVQEGSMRLDDTLGTLIPDFAGTDKEPVTVADLLTHASGYPDHRPYYRELAPLPPEKRRQRLHRLLVDEPLAQRPAGASLYSDLGYMVLQWVVETRARKALDQLVAERVYAPTALEGLRFFRTDDKGQGGATVKVAATEACPWRGRVLQGEVHDENASVMGGVAGHAGLFGTAGDVWALLCELMGTYLGGAPRGLFRRETVESFWDPPSVPGPFVLGFDTPSPTRSSAGRFFSRRSVGHLGFTGTSFWMDLERQVVVVLLTNRVHPSRSNDRIKTFRPVLHDAVMEAVLHGNPRPRLHFPTV